MATEILRVLNQKGEIMNEKIISNIKLIWYSKRILNEKNNF